MTQVGWEYFEHQADVGIRGFGDTIEAAFQQAAIALTTVITHAEVRAEKSFPVQCTASTIEDLFVDWLNNLIYEMATRNLLIGRSQVKIKGATLKATVWGEGVDVSRHQPAVEVKGATYTELKVKEDENGNWLVQCVLDV